MPSTMRLISKQTLGSDTGTVTFSNIPQTYTDLYLVCAARTDRADNGDAILLQFNGNTGNNYSTRSLYGTGTTAVSASWSNVTGIYLVQAACANSNPANTFGNSETYIPNYMGSTNKSVSHSGTSEINSANGYMSVDAGIWSNTAAITSLLLKPFNGTNFKTGSTFYLYAVTSAAGSVPGTFGIDATGGSEVFISGGYKHHVFRSSGVFNVTQPGWVEYLVVGGGGAGGSDRGGGGGAGGYLSSIKGESSGGGVSRGPVLLSPGTIPVLVGAGGPSGSTFYVKGQNGSDSAIGTYVVAFGGGGGGSGDTSQKPGNSGGSGGGSANSNPQAASGSSLGNQGYSGGQGSTTTGGGGGGGAGGVGANGSGTVGGNGGAGISSSATGTSVARAGGGGAGANSSGGTGQAGGGNGAAGDNSSAGGNASVNTGSGGGGATGGGSPLGGAGGSGIVVIRYPVS